MFTKDYNYVYCWVGYSKVWMEQQTFYLGEQKKDNSYQGRDLRALQSKGFFGQVLILEGLQIVGYR